MSEAAITARGFVECFYFCPLHLFVARYHELGNALTVLYDEGDIAEIDEDNADLSPVVCIDGTGCVEEGDAVFHGQPRSGTYLRFIAFGQCNGKSRGHERAAQRWERDGAVEKGAEIHTGTETGGRSGKWVVRTIDDGDAHRAGVGSESPDIRKFCPQNYAIKGRNSPLSPLFFLKTRIFAV